LLTCKQASNTLAAAQGATNHHVRAEDVSYIINSSGRTAAAAAATGISYTATPTTAARRVAHPSKASARADVSSSAPVALSAAINGDAIMAAAPLSPHVACRKSPRRTVAAANLKGGKEAKGRSQHAAADAGWCSKRLIWCLITPNMVPSSPGAWKWLHRSDQVGLRYKMRAIAPRK
jgi:hypothetical protein